jgi:hypothetical protein
LFTQIINLISFAVGILILGFLIIVISRWFLRRSLKIRANSYENQPYNNKSIIDNPANEIDSSSFFDEWNIKKYKESLDSLKFYYSSNQPNKLSEKENIEDKSLELLKTHLDKILTYIKNKLLYLRENYGKKIIWEDYIFDTIKNFGILEVDLITSYHSIITAINVIYNHKFEEKMEVNRLFSGAGEFLKYKKLLEIINFEIQENSITKEDSIN